MIDDGGNATQRKRMTSTTFPGEAVLYVAYAGIVWVIVNIDGTRSLSILNGRVTLNVNRIMPTFDGDTWVLLNDLSHGRSRKQYVFPWMIDHV